MDKKISFSFAIVISISLIISAGCSSTAEKAVPQQPATNSSEKSEVPDTSVSNAEPSKSNDNDLVYKLPNMSKVEIKKDIVYKADGGEQLKLDVYYPLNKKETGLTPTVLLVHGSAPVDSLKDTLVYQSWGRVIAASGFTAVTFNWRPNGSQSDVSDLIKYLREHAAELKLNQDSLSIFAFSAGVKEGVKEALLANTGFIKGIVVYYGELDNSVFDTPGVTLSPMLIAMGALDNNFPPTINDKFITTAEARGCNITSLVHTKGVHGFDVLNDDDETTQIIDKTLEFIRNINA